MNIGSDDVSSASTYSRTHPSPPSLKRPPVSGGMAAIPQRSTFPSKTRTHRCVLRRGGRDAPLGFVTVVRRSIAPCLFRTVRRPGPSLENPAVACGYIQAPRKSPSLYRTAFATRQPGFTIDHHLLVRASYICASRLLRLECSV